MDAVLLIDFGSTFTKVTAVDAGEARLLGCAAARTTADTDVGEGLEAAMRDLAAMTGAVAYKRRLACSSAAGGLRMVVCGLVPDLTAKAARMASMGAGAKVVRAFSFNLTEEDVREIDALAPDILLLTGGTDGGNDSCVLHNAAALLGASGDFPVVVAGNRTATGRIVGMFGEAGRAVYPCDNVMPALGAINVGPARDRIRGVFLERIVRAKGLSRETALVDGIMMPTPAAVLTAVELLSRGHGDEPGIGELVAVDLGGATTDVYSVAAGLPQAAAVAFRGLPEPVAMRTVEGDLGMRFSAAGVVDSAGAGRVAELSGIPEERVRVMAEALSGDPDALPCDGESRALDFALAALAVEAATVRHAGTMERVYTAAGPALVQTGKDLRDVGNLVMTGGALIHAGDPAALAAFAACGEPFPQSLRPEAARVSVDGSYILSAMGLLAAYSPGVALSIMKETLREPLIK